MLPTYTQLSDLDLARIAGAVADVRKANRAKAPAPKATAA
jgi:hypothetical protein